MYILLISRTSNAVCFLCLEVQNTKVALFPNIFGIDCSYYFICSRQYLPSTLRTIRVSPCSIKPFKSVWHHQDDKTYHMVGVEPLVDDEEMVHHFAMSGCSMKTDEPGVVIQRSDMDVQCNEYLYIWTPGLGKNPILNCKCVCSLLDYGCVFFMLGANCNLETIILQCKQCGKQIRRPENLPRLPTSAQVHRWALFLCCRLQNHRQLRRHSCVSAGAQNVIIVAWVLDHNFLFSVHFEFTPRRLIPLVRLSQAWKS